MALKRLRLFKGDTLTGLVESFIGFTDLAGAAGEQATYIGDPVSINNNATKVLPVTTLTSGVDLLDRTNPAAPTFLEAGTYSMTLTINGDALTAGGYAQGIIQPGAAQAYAYDESQHPPQLFSVALVAVVEAGDLLGVYAVNHDGVAARNFALHNLVLVKL